MYNLDKKEGDESLFFFFVCGDIVKLKNGGRSTDWSKSLWKTSQDMKWILLFLYVGIVLEYFALNYLQDKIQILLSRLILMAPIYYLNLIQEDEDDSFSLSTYIWVPMV